MRRLRQGKIPPSSEKWEYLQEWRMSLKERCLKIFLSAIIPVSLLILLPFLTGGTTRKLLKKEYNVKIVEEVKKEPKPLPPPPSKKANAEKVVKVKQVTKKKRIPDRERNEEQEKPPEEKKVFGVDPDSVISDKGAGIAVPVGDTLMMDPKDSAIKSVPPPPPEKEIFSTKEVTKQPFCVNRVTPEYTEEALDNHIEGVVVLIATITKEGKAKDIRVLRGLGFGLDEECIKAVEKSLYQPAIRNGKRVACRIKTKFKFKIE